MDDRYRDTEIEVYVCRYNTHVHKHILRQRKEGETKLLNLGGEYRGVDHIRHSLFCECKIRHTEKLNKRRKSGQ